MKDEERRRLDAVLALREESQRRRAEAAAGRSLARLVLLVTGVLVTVVVVGAGVRTYRRYLRLQQDLAVSQMVRPPAAPPAPAPDRLVQPIGEGPTRPSADDELAPISKAAVVAGLNAVKPAVLRCYARYRVPGVAMVNVVIGTSGRVTSAVTTGRFQDTPTGSCVERAVRGAVFPPSQGLTTPYPFNLR